MRKNRMMRLASALLILTMVTTCAISGTFAKYVTEDSGSDSARVAKFGVVVEAKDFGMFEPDYNKEEGTFTGQFSVSSATGDRDDLLAPGTSGSFADIAITGTPEVAVDVAIVADVAVTGNWTVDGDFYCPIVVTVGTEEFNGLDYDSGDEFAAAIKAKIDGKSEQYAPNTDLGALYDNDTDSDTNLDLAWAWAFEGAAGSEQTNEKDTKLGDAAAAADLGISIGVEITVSQLN